MADADRGFVSQYSEQDIGVSILVGSTQTDADGPVTVTITNTDTQAVLRTATATRLGLGVYQVTLSPDDTGVTGNYQAVWSYHLSGVQRTYNAYFAIGGAEPAYDALDAGMKSIVDSVWMRMADMFDSPNGGPFLQTRRPTNFTRGRIAQLLRIAIGRLNTMAQPTSQYSIDPGGQTFPVGQWGSLLEQLTWIETIKHLRRSYLEQPVVGGASISLLDRQAYYDRWGQILADEEANVENQLSNFKIAQMFLGRPAVLVGGGVFGRAGGYNNRIFNVARGPLMWANRWM